MPATPTPPVAPRRPVALEAHGDVRVDDYYWLRDRDDPGVTGYLEAENAYTEAMTAHTAERRDQLFEEMRSRIQETDLSVPWRRDAWWYYSRTVEGLQYPIHCRKPGSLDAPEQVLLDENAEAGGHDFFDLGALEVSPAHRLAAWSCDVAGDEAFVLRVRDLGTGADLGDEIANTYYGVAWANDDATVFYTTLDAAKRPWQVWRHRVGTPGAADVLVHQEDDERFHVGLGRTRTGRFVVVQIHSAVTTECHLIDADDPAGAPRLVAPRRQGVEYEIEHHGEQLFVVTNDEAENFRLMAAPLATPGRAHWREVVAHRPGVRLEEVDAFARHLVLYERAGGVRRIRVMDLASGEVHEIDQPEAVSTALPGDNAEFTTTTLRYRYTSLVTPQSVFDYDMDARTRELMKRQPVLGGYDPADYATERLWATAADGAAVPISLVHRRDLAADRPLPTLLYGYGAYEASIDPGFSSLRLSLLDRGMVFAIAHVRGGGEMGRPWYEQGKFLYKPNSFSDFLACAEHLVAEGVAAADQLAVRGGSAGGLLIGATVNQRPERFRAVVAEVPFVDCLTTILDETLPLTVIEWEEWGNPNQAEFYACMKGYSPYDNIRAAPYPAMLVTAGLNDPRVAYWEPAKWVAKLRATTTATAPILLKTELGAGHMGPSGRYDAWADEAFVYAFVLDALGVEHAVRRREAPSAGAG